MSDAKLIHIIGGGTVQHVRTHFAVCAPAYGSTARRLKALCHEHPDNNLDAVLHLTRMAGGASTLETNEDVGRLVDELVADNRTKIIFFNPALCDFRGTVLDPHLHIKMPSGKHASRLHSSDGEHEMRLVATEKLVQRIRRTRKDVTLVAFKATAGATEDEQYIEGLNLLKASSANLVLANDTITRLNMIITPEESRYHVTKDREDALRNLVDMAMLRSHLTFTRSTVVAGEPVPWNSPDVPEALRAVVDACIAAGAYKPFRGATVGHFACKLDDTTFLTSRRKTNFNDLPNVGLVKVKTDGPDSVIAYGSRPSVGGQSQRIIFSEHPEYDCVTHAHVPMRPGAPDDIPVRSQREFECGSHACGKNASAGLKDYDLGDGDRLAAVMLDKHGPNIVFHRSVNPAKVIAFIERNFNLTQKTGGYVALPKKGA